MLTVPSADAGVMRCKTKKRATGTYPGKFPAEENAKRKLCMAFRTSEETKLLQLTTELTSLTRGAYKYQREVS